jgi:hypothetical protein
MNKRIAELAEQAMQYAETLHGRFHEGHEDPNWDTFVAYEQKFAELIVQECARIGELKEQGSSEYDLDISVGHYMRQHFGVEE